MSKAMKASSFSAGVSFVARLAQSLAGRSRSAISSLLLATVTLSIASPLALASEAQLSRPETRPEIRPVVDHQNNTRVRPMSAELRVRRLDSGPASQSNERPDSNLDRRVLEYCEMGRCRALGPARGYRADEWSAVAQLCSSEGRWAGPTQALVQTLIILAAYRTGSGVLFMIGGAGLSDLGAAGSGSVNAQDLERAGTRLPGLLRDDVNHVLSLDGFVSLRNGLQYCARLYEDRRVFHRLLQICPNPLICSKESQAWAQQADDEA